MFSPPHPCLNLIEPKIAPFDPPTPKTLVSTKHGSASDSPFARYSPLKYTVTLKLRFGVTQGHQKWHCLTEHIRLYIIFIFYGKYASVYYRFQYIAAYWSKIATPLYLAPPLGVKLSDLCNIPWRWKTRMMGLSDSERISMIHSAVLIQYACSDRRTDRQTDGIAVAYMHHRIILSRVTTMYESICSDYKLLTRQSNFLFVYIIKTLLQFRLSALSLCTVYQTLLPVMTHCWKVKSQVPILQCCDAIGWVSGR